MKTLATLHRTIHARLPRLFGWMVFTLLLAALVLCIAPRQLPLSLYKLSLVTLAGVVGYWLDRSMFPYARPDQFLPMPETLDLPGCDAGEIERELQVDMAALARLAGLCMQRRAMIVAATMLAMGLGA